jgi:hypothetical protein
LHLEQETNPVNGTPPEPCFRGCVEEPNKAFPTYAVLLRSLAYLIDIDKQYQSDGNDGNAIGEIGCDLH